MRNRRPPSRSFRRETRSSRSGSCTVVACVDLRARTVIWAQQGPLSPPARPDPGRRSAVDLRQTKGAGRPAHACLSSIRLADRSAGATWARTEQPFFSSTCGTAQRLPGGNTLITETDAGRAFEITPEGRIVWEFLRPFPRRARTMPSSRRYFEVRRLDPDYSTDWLR